MTGAANRRRGADAERAVVAYLRENGWPDARRYMAGDGRQPGDIDAIPGIAIEVKDRAGSAWPTWRMQAIREACGRVPVVVRRTRGNPDVGAWQTNVPFVWFARNGGGDWPNHHCTRTGWVWTITTFATVCELVREEVAS